MAENMERKTVERDLKECAGIADRTVAKQRAEDEKAGRRPQLTSGEIVALRVFVLLLAGNPGRSGVKGADEIAIQNCMYDRGYVSRVLDDSDAEGFAAAQDAGKEMEFLQRLYRRDFRTSKDAPLPN